MQQITPADDGTGLALSLRMIIRKVEELTAYQFVLELKLEVYRLLASKPEMRREFKYAGQVRDALGDVEADVAEGFARKNPGEFANFLRFALASLAEVRTRLKDGVARGCLTDADVAISLVWDERARIALENLRDSQLRMAEKWKRERRGRNRTRRAPRSTGARPDS